MTLSTIILIYLLIINILTFIVFGIDKYRACNNGWRIPEATLFLLALIGGSIGAELGMHIWHHKTKHLSFVIGIPLIMVLQVVFCGLFIRFLASII